MVEVVESGSVFSLSLSITTTSDDDGTDRLEQEAVAEV